MSQNAYDICLPICLKSNCLVSILGVEYFQRLKCHRRMFLLLDIFHRKACHLAPFLDTDGFPQLSWVWTCQPGRTDLRREVDLRKCELCLHRVWRIYLLYHHLKFHPRDREAIQLQSQELLLMAFNAYFWRCLWNWNLAQILQ